MLGIDERPGRERSKKSKKSSSSSKKRRKDVTDDSDEDDDDDDDATWRTLRKDRMVPSHPVTDVSQVMHLRLICCYVSVSAAVIQRLQCCILVP